MPASEIEDHRSYVFYGRSGTGKTTVACSFPKPLLLLDINDRGTDSVSDVEDVMVMRVGELDDFEMAYWYLMQHPDEYATVVIDTVSQLQSTIIEDVLSSKSKDAEKAGDWGVLSKRDWGQVGSILKTWITRFRDLPMEVVFVAQDRVFNVGEEEDTDGQLDPEVGPQLMPSAVRHLNASVHLIANTFIREKIRVKKLKGGKKEEVARIQFCARVGPNPVYITKVRKPKKVELPSVIIDPEYEDLLEIIQGE